MIAKNAGNFTQRAGTIVDDRAQSRRSAIATLPPTQVNPIGVGSVSETITFDRMHLNRLARQPEPDDPVTRNGVTAFTEVVTDAWRKAAYGDGAFLIWKIKRDAIRVKTRHQCLHQGVVINLAKADAMHQLFLILKLQPVHRGR